MQRRKDSNGNRLDDAARAGWLYYVAKNTQDEIAEKMGISRQSAQRLVSLAVSEGLIKVRVDHPIARCLELGRELKARFGLKSVEVVPSDPGSSSTTVGLAEAGATAIEKALKSSAPIIMALGTGRTLKAAVDQLPQMDCPQHKIVSLTGSIAPDGSAAFYNVIFSMSDAVKARHYPMPLPVYVSSPEERALLHQQEMIHSTLELAARADMTFVGIGELGHEAPLREDRFITDPEMDQLMAAGAVGEITGWVFDAKGQLIAGNTNARVASAPIPSRENSLVTGMAMGEKKLPAIAAAVRGGLINGLITDELTAEKLLSDS
ncbi:sugar-binding transcriptional regulator [Pelagibius sp. Alg239-R121]|uniref:sugar-binding transcriptional regulator n=1 Tax=Pelagibius sp. Alg239-R121 TaxID=2993448 RepID=UPI0024A75DE9|nr:sugar-binding transcriptional regulator [Pelagibius sp. Alg239-R121]